MKVMRGHYHFIIFAGGAGLTGGLLPVKSSPHLTCPWSTFFHDWLWRLGPPHPIRAVAPPSRAAEPALPHRAWRPLPLPKVPAALSGVLAGGGEGKKPTQVRRQSRQGARFASDQWRTGTEQVPCVKAGIASYESGCKAKYAISQSSPWPWWIMRERGCLLETVHWCAE